MSVKETEREQKDECKREREREQKDECDAPHTSSQQRRLTAARYSMCAHSWSRCFRNAGKCFLQLLPSAQGKISYLLSSSSSSMVLARYLGTLLQLFNSELLRR